MVDDGSHEDGEPIASWVGEGNLTQNVFNANLLLLDAQPTLVLEGAKSVVAERGETFALAVKANDFPDIMYKNKNLNNQKGKEIVANMIKVATLTRKGFMAGDISTVMSPRTVLHLSLIHI